MTSPWERYNSVTDSQKMASPAAIHDKLPLNPDASPVTGGIGVLLEAEVETGAVLKTEAETRELGDVEAKSKDVALLGNEVVMALVVRVGANEVLGVRVEVDVVLETEEDVVEVEV